MLELVGRRFAPVATLVPICQSGMGLLVRTAK